MQTIGDQLLLNSFKNKKLLLSAALLFIALVYFSTMSVNHSEAEDSQYYLMNISRGSLSDQVHPNHLLYNLINYIFLHTWQFFGYEGGVELPVKVINIAGSLGCILLIYQLASYLNFSFLLRYFCIFAVAFSCGFWWYSVECETYILPLVFTLLSFHQLVKIHADFNKPLNHALLGLFSALAMLMHQQQSLSGLTIFIGYFFIFFFDRHTMTWKIFLPRISLYILVCFSVVFISYCLVAILIQDLTSFDQIVDWGQGWLSKKRLFKFGYWSTASFFLGLIGFIRTFIGGHFLFSFEWFSNLLEKNLPHIMFREEIFLVKDFGSFKSLSLAVLSILIIFLMSVIILQIIKPHRLRAVLSDESGQQRARFCLIILLTYSIIFSLFAIYWEPQNTEHWIAIVPIFVLIFGLLTNRIIHKWRIQISLVFIVICLFVVNLFGSVLPQTSHDHDYWYAFNSWLINNCDSQDLVLSGSGIISDGYVKYHTGAKVISIFPDPDDRPLEKKFEEFVSNHNPKRILFSSTVYSPPEQYLKKFELDHSDTRAFFIKSKKYLSLIHDDSWQTIYVYNNDR